MAVGDRRVDVEKSLKEAQDATRVGALAPEIEWISAAAAVELIKPHFKNSAFAAQRRICEFADAKLVRARARRYIIGEAARDDSVVPYVFWWAKGHEALEQDWPTGSFSTWINDTQHRAFGVTFARADIEKMIPADQLAKSEATAVPAARAGQTVQQKQRRIQQLQDCIKDLEAFDINNVRNRVPPEAMALENSIDEALSAAFGHGTVEYGRYKSAARLDHGPRYTPSMVAMAAAPRGVRVDVSAQQAQEAQQYLSEGSKQSIVLLQQAIRALEREIADQALESDQAEKPATSTAQVGGRPPADWWEDLIIDICFKNFRGELKPKTQADVARAMQTWITQRGYEAADSTVRVRARKVWNAIQQDAEN